MTTVALSESVTGVLNGAGAGTLRLGPKAHGVVWKPQVASIRMSGAPPAGLAICSVYVGPSATDDNFQDSTYDANNASTGRVDSTRLELGDYVFAVWQVGNPNATVTLTVTGTKDIP